MKLKHTDWKSLPRFWNLNDEVDHCRTSGISFATNKQMLSMGHEYITRKYMEVLKNKNHCKKGGTFIKFFEGDKQNNRFGARSFYRKIV